MSLLKVIVLVPRPALGLREERTGHAWSRKDRAWAAQQPISEKSLSYLVRCTENRVITFAEKKAVSRRVSDASRCPCDPWRWSGTSGLGASAPDRVFERHRAQRRPVSSFRVHAWAGGSEGGFHNRGMSVPSDEHRSGTNEGSLAESSPLSEGPRWPRSGASTDNGGDLARVRV